MWAIGFSKNAANLDKNSAPKIAPMIMESRLLEEMTSALFFRRKT